MLICTDHGVEEMYGIDGGELVLRWDLARFFRACALGVTW